MVSYRRRQRVQQNVDGNGPCNTGRVPSNIPVGSSSRHPRYPLPARSSPVRRSTKRDRRRLSRGSHSIDIYICAVSSTSRIGVHGTPSSDPRSLQPFRSLRRLPGGPSRRCAFTAALTPHGDAIHFLALETTLRNLLLEASVFLCPVTSAMSAQTCSPQTRFVVRYLTGIQCVDMSS